MDRQLNLFKSKRQRGVRVEKDPLEFALHCSVADLLRRWAKPEWQWTSIPLGEERPAVYRDGQRVSFAGARLARMGVMPGWPDIVLIAPKDHPRAGAAHFLELKRERGGRMTEDQAAFEHWCELNEVPHAVARDLDEAIAALAQWGVWRRGVSAQ